MGQLCKHFAHKIQASFDADSGRIAFPFGLCELATGEDLLVMCVSAANDEDLARMEDVIARHLVRFAFREPPQVDIVSSDSSANDSTPAAVAVRRVMKHV